MMASATLASTLFWSSCSSPAASPVTIPAVPVVTAKAELGDFPVTIRVPAVVEPHTSVIVKAEVLGELRRVLVREGQPVHRGDILFEIEPEPYAAALAQAKAQLVRDTAQVQQAEANLERDKRQAQNAQTQADRYKQLAAEGIVSKEQNDQFRTTAEMAAESLAADQAALEVAKAATAVDRAAVERANVDLDHCTIRSPTDGVAGYLAVQQGNLVKGNADTALVTINEIVPAVVSFSVPDRYLSEVRQRLVLGPLPLRVYAPGEGRELSSGSVSLLDNSVDNSTGTIRLKGVVPNKDHRLWPSQSLEAMLTLTTERHVVIVPKEAVQQSEQGPFVFVVTKNEIADLRPVSIRAEGDGNVVVTRGVDPGADVVVDGQLRLRPGTKVKITSPHISPVPESRP